jgi:hypothetical protein
MSSNRTEQSFYPTEILTDERLNDALDAIRDAATDRVADLITSVRAGLLSAINITPSGSLDMGVDIPAFEAYDISGRHVRIGSATNAFDCSVDYQGNATRPTSGHRYCSIFAFFDWNKTDPVTVDSTTYYKQWGESVYLRLYMGAAVDLSKTPVPPLNPGNGAIRLCTVRTYEGQTAIAQSDIHTDGGHQDVLGHVLLTTGGQIITSPNGIKGGRLVESAHGVTQFGSYASRIGDDSFLVKYVPPWLHEFAAAAAYLNHGLKSGQVMIHKKINLPGSGTYGANYIDVHDVLLTGQGDTNSGMLWTFHVHDGVEGYTGQSGLLAIGSQSWAQSLVGKWIRWAAFLSMGDMVF